MFTIIVVGLACMAFGLYAGKRRADGTSWYMIASELTSSAWRLVSNPFKKGRGGGSCGSKNG